MSKNLNSLLSASESVTEDKSFRPMFADSHWLRDPSGFPVFQWVAPSGASDIIQHNETLDETIAKARALLEQANVSRLEDERSLSSPIETRIRVGSTYYHKFKETFFILEAVSSETSNTIVREVFSDKRVEMSSAAFKLACVFIPCCTCIDFGRQCNSCSKFLQDYSSCKEVQVAEPIHFVKWSHQ